MNFNYFLPVNLMFGRGKLNLIGETVKKYGKKALIVTGTSSTKKSGVLDNIISLLNKSGIEAVVYDKVTQNPLTTTVEDGVEFAKANSCDVIIGVGGGSVMDCSKGIAFFAKNDGDINDYIFNVKTSDESLPVILIPTTCGTGSEGNGFAVLTNPETLDKKSLRCNAIIPKASIIDSTLMETMPKHILASVGFDALCHNIEAYIAKNSQPLTDALAVYAMQLIGESLVKLYEGENSPELWDKLSLASTIGGMLINTTGVTVAHGMEHPASGLKDLVHGKGLAALIPVVMKKTELEIPEKCAIISKSLGGTSHTDCHTKIEELLSKLDMKIGLAEQGITKDDIPWMVENYFKISIASHNNHPVIFTTDEISDIYQSSL